MKLLSRVAKLAARSDGYQSIFLVFLSTREGFVEQR